LFPVLSVPQSVSTIGQLSLLQILGGMIFVVILMAFLGYCIYKTFDFKYKWTIFLIPIFFLISEIFVNFVCGSDNLSRTPYPVCQNTIVWIFVQSTPFLLILIIGVIAFPNIYSKIPQWLNSVE
jgi:hypothetical protein